MRPIRRGAIAAAAVPIARRGGNAATALAGLGYEPFGRGVRGR